MSDRFMHSAGKCPIKIAVSADTPFTLLLAKVCLVMIQCVLEIKS